METHECENVKCNTIVCIGCHYHEMKFRPNLREICHVNDDAPCELVDGGQVPSRCICMDGHRLSIFRNARICLKCDAMKKWCDKNIKQDMDYYICTQIDAFFTHLSNWESKTIDDHCLCYAEYLVNNLNKK